MRIGWGVSQMCNDYIEVGAVYLVCDQEQITKTTTNGLFLFCSELFYVLVQTKKK